MGRFHIGGFDSMAADRIVKLFSGVAIAIRPPKDKKISAEERSVSFRFNSATYGKILLRILPKEKAIMVFIAHDREEPPQKYHLIRFSDCEKVYHYRNDANGDVSVVFEDKHGRHLQVTEYGEVYLGQFLSWQELGDAFPDSSAEKCPMPNETAVL